MQHHRFLAAALIVTLWLGAGSAQMPSAMTHTLPGPATYPEGIALDPASGTFFVGSTRDGAVYQGNTQRPGQLRLFLAPGQDGRTGVTGLALDRQRRLFIAGRTTGRAWVYDSRSGRLIKALRTPAAQATLINDVAVTEDAAYFTDSLRPTLFRVSLTGGVGEMEAWLDLRQTPIQYRSGDSLNERVNLNGIVASEDGRYLLTVQFNTGRLYRIDTRSKAVSQVGLGGRLLPFSDGLALSGRRLYVVLSEPGVIAQLELNEDFSQGEVQRLITDPSLTLPGTLALTDRQMLVVNTQLVMSGEQVQPRLPFSVSTLDRP